MFAEKPTGSAKEIEIPVKSGAPIPVLHWQGEPGRGGVVIAHGVYSHAGWFRKVAGGFQERGLSVVAYDRMGCGRSKSCCGHVEDYRQFVVELGEVIDWMRAGRPEMAVHLTGQSYGSLVVLAYAARAEGTLQSLTLVTPGLATKKRLKWWETALVPILSRVRPRHQLPLPMRAADFTDNQDVIRAVESDVLCGRTASARFFWETLFFMRQVRGTAGAIRTPVFMALAGNDGICNNEVARKYFDRIGVRDKSIKVYERSMHSLLMGNQSEEFIRDWRDWIMRHENLGV